jgi:putative Mn2+ efflux pump MntP
MLAVATSIDALAVGISFAFIRQLLPFLSSLKKIFYNALFYLHWDGTLL